jgi:hypothetical protein
VQGAERRRTLWHDIDGVALDGSLVIDINSPPHRAAPKTRSGEHLPASHYNGPRKNHAVER